VEAIGTRLDAIAAERFADLERALARQGHSADAIAALHARLVAEWLVWKFETLAQLEAQLRVWPGSPA
jgi:hypothetical protein